MTANGVFAMSAVTALTAQNTTGVSGIMDVSPEFLGEQLDRVFEDIFPDAVKIGMVSSTDLIRMIASKLKEYKAVNIVLDPVMVATSGAKLISDDAIASLEEDLIPLADVVTPNVPEAEVLSGMKITNKEEMEEAAQKMGETFYGCDRCLRATPQFAESHPTAEPAFQPSEALLQMAPDDWQNLTEEQYRNLFKGSAIKRAKYDGLKRNIERWLKHCKS